MAIMGIYEQLSIYMAIVGCISNDEFIMAIMGIYEQLSIFMAIMGSYWQLLVWMVIMSCGRG